MVMAGVELGRNLGSLCWSIGATLGLYGLYKLFTFVYHEVTSPLRDLPGPPSKSWIYGNFKEIWDGEGSVVQEKWIEEYGSTIRFKGIFGRDRLYTTDLKALNHIFANNYDYQKPEWSTYNIKRILGEGLLLVEGDVHKHQRRVLNPAFGPQQIRELTETFIEKSIQLRDIWMSQVAESTSGVQTIDALSWLSRTTLDIIGLAGFNYKFDALTDPDRNELNKAFAIMFKAGTSLSVIPFLRAMFSFLRFLPAERDTESRKAAETMRQIGVNLLQESKARMVKDSDAAKASSASARDILSLLVRANTMPDLHESQRMSDKDVLAQIPTFLVAGHETTSVATTWALFALTQHKSVQSKLREELLTISTDNPTMDELNGLPYLDGVIREVLRLYAPVPSTIRAAMKDDYLPLAKPFVDRKGVIRHEIRVTKGQTMTIPILPINRAKSLWGEDASEFKPERWQNVPEAVAAVPGVWGNMLTFLGGPKACIGYRFTLVEMKAILFTLIRAFEFDLAVPASDIGKRSVMVQRPILLSDPDRANKLPLLVKAVSHH